MDSKNVVKLKLTRQEAWAALRGLGVAHASDRTAKEDKGPLEWVIQRLCRILEVEPTGDENE